MRFRKRIKICKGLSINLSKSGTSLTLGGRGASINVGKKGTYLNTSIPGTGIYNRQKLGGQAPKKIKQNTGGPSREIKKQVIMNFSVSLDEMGKPIIKDENGNIIIDPNIIKQLKRQESYKDIVRKLVISRKEQIDKINRDFIDIFKQTPNINDMRSYQSELNELRFQEYAMDKFSKEEPSLEKIKSEYQAKSKNPINKILFWKKENKTDYDLSVIYQLYFPTFC